MTGPTIIATAAPTTPPAVKRARTEGRTGVMRSANGAINEWHAISNGRLVGTFHGKRAYLAATRAAGSTTVIA